MPNKHSNLILLEDHSKASFVDISREPLLFWHKNQLLKTWGEENQKSLRKKGISEWSRELREAEMLEGCNQHDVIRCTFTENTGNVGGKQWERKSERESSGVSSSYTLNSPCDSHWVSPVGGREGEAETSPWPGKQEKWKHVTTSQIYRILHVPPLSNTHSETLIRDLGRCCWQPRKVLDGFG